VSCFNSEKRIKQDCSRMQTGMEFEPLGYRSIAKSIRHPPPSISLRMGWSWGQSFVPRCVGVSLLGFCRLCRRRWSLLNPSPPPFSSPIPPPPPQPKYTPADTSPRPSHPPASLDQNIKPPSGSQTRSESKYISVEERSHVFPENQKKTHRWRANKRFGCWLLGGGGV